jgi:hypothetical protein
MDPAPTLGRPKEILELERRARVTASTRFVELGRYWKQRSKGGETILLIKIIEISPELLTVYLVRFANQLFLNIY